MVPNVPYLWNMERVVVEYMCIMFNTVLIIILMNKYNLLCSHILVSRISMFHFKRYFYLIFITEMLFS